MRFAGYVVRFACWTRRISLLNGRTCVEAKTGTPSRGSSISSPVAFTTSDFATASSDIVNLNAGVSTTTSAIADAAIRSASANTTVFRIPSFPVAMVCLLFF